MAKEVSRSESLIAGAGWLALIIGGLIAAPYVVGYGIAFGGYVPYGVVCNTKDDLFSGRIDPRNYATFLMNRGCDYNAEIMRILVDPTFKDVDAHRVIGIIKSGATPDNSAHEILVADVVKGVSRTFKAPETEDSCGRGEASAYCASNRFWGDDIISSFFANVSASYLTYFLPRMSDAIFDGANLLINFSRLGTVFGAGLFVGYALVIGIVSGFAIRMVGSIMKG
ncbi:hypothetical protein IYX23_14565 [Methylocystis sp. L43]|jgi:hypothetical protein|uniref:hypothetical protein n=1 Tax=unclassified Methylocystis TaxID=2625913 RepID=UPI0018C26E10|nr:MULTISPECIES: hypothetical protein [unclassified Methylocystis]MBG0798888.1 hypothetical protein [Methylocystis sp. L43]MBG0806395.1 hypothetical protein [Methylocystis sp. H15]